MASKKKKTRDSWALLIRVLMVVTIVLATLALYEWWKARNAGFIRYAAYGIPLPAPFSLHGIDVSSYQRSINWNAVHKMTVKGVKIGFAFIKATEGISDIDPYFSQNWKKAKAAGVTAGAYHFFIASRSGKSQAAHFIRQVQLTSGDLPPVIDIEDAYGTAPEVLQSRIRECLVALERHYGVTPILYTNVEFYNNYLGESFDSYPLWVAHYINRGRPRISRDWFFWQHSESGTVNGIRGNVDFNVFKGDSAAFKKLLIP